MQCPVCPETSLTMTTRQDIEIDYCPKCRGVWLDRGELDKIIERTVQDQPMPAMQPTFSQSPREEYRDGHGSSRSSHGSSHGGGKHGSFLKRLFD